MALSWGMPSRLWFPWGRLGTDGACDVCCGQKRQRKNWITGIAKAFGAWEFLSSADEDVFARFWQERRPRRRSKSSPFVVSPSMAGSTDYQGIRGTPRIAQNTLGSETEGRCRAEFCDRAAGRAAPQPWTGTRLSGAQEACCSSSNAGVLFGPITLIIGARSTKTFTLKRSKIKARQDLLPPLSLPRGEAPQQRPGCGESLAGGAEGNK